MPRSRISATCSYINTGDWVESCTAVVEHFDGRMEILTWAQVLPEVADEPFIPMLIEDRVGPGGLTRTSRRL